MSEKYTFLVVPLDAMGHFNACEGIAGQLRDRGHKVVFATPLTKKGLLEPKGFIEECYSCSLNDETGSVSNEKWGALINQMVPALALDAHDKAFHLCPTFYKENLSQIKYSNAKLAEIMARVKPDAVIIDNLFESPALINNGTPWVFLASVSPLFVSSKNVPPAFLGLPTNGDKSVWKPYWKRHEETFYKIYLNFKSWLAENGGSTDLKFYPPFFHSYSPFANIYMYPQELDYLAYRPLPPNWYAFDSFVRSTEESFQIPKELDRKPGKLIYFSMGTIGSSELGLMRRLIAILAKSPNRFIASKGPLADKYELPDNMWGARNVPQTKILPLVDLVISHGGNNTITETFYFGKRVLVLPLFNDQLDNGQRIFETGHGLHFHPYHVTETELLGGIESLLKDDMLERRMTTIGQRMRASNSQAAAADLIESVARKGKTQKI